VQTLQSIGPATGMPSQRVPAEALDPQFDPAPEFLNFEYWQSEAETTRDLKSTLR
jgi:hypothetical protein